MKEIREIARRWIGKDHEKPKNYLGPTVAGEIESAIRRFLGESQTAREKSLMVSVNGKEVGRTLIGKQKNHRGHYEPVYGYFFEMPDKTRLQRTGIEAIGTEAWMYMEDVRTGERGEKMFNMTSGEVEAFLADMPRPVEKTNQS